MHLYLIRHAEHGLAPGLLAGRMPGVSLSPAGRDAAALLARDLARTPLAAILSSPLERARETAEAIARPHEFAVDICEGANEVDFGEWTGRPFTELDRRDDWRFWNACRGVARCPGGESMGEAQARALAAIHEAAARHAGEAVALVTHGDIVRAVLCAFLGMPVDMLLRLEIDLASTSVVELGARGPRVLLVNQPPGPAAPR